MLCYDRDIKLRYIGDRTSMLVITNLKLNMDCRPGYTPVSAGSSFMSLNRHQGRKRNISHIG